MKAVVKGALVGAGLGAAAVLLCPPDAPLRVFATLHSSPKDLLARVERVEEEPRRIPFVRSVEVERRGTNDAVYVVRVCAAGLPGWARFHKRFDREACRADWTTLDGFLGFQQTGSISFTPDGAGATQAEIECRTRFAVPFIGRALAQGSRFGLSTAFTAWLTGLDAP